MAGVTAIQQACVGRPDHVLFQSFAGASGNQLMPVNRPELPASEDAEVIYRHTRLVIQGTNEIGE